MKRILLCDSDLLTKLSDEVPSNKMRQSLVQGLIKGYKLDELCEIIDVEPIEYKRLTLYHDMDFIKQLILDRKEIDQQSENHEVISNKISEVFDLIEDLVDDEVDAKDDELYGLSHDCYPFPFMKYYINLTAASTIQLSERMCEYIKSQHQQQFQSKIIGLNFYGGRHHGSKSKASGFCYINDINLGISTIRKNLPNSNIFYLDLDLHYGNGVAEAFKFSQKVTTCSVHRFDVGFFPNAGSFEESRTGAYNISTKRGLNDESLKWILEEVVLNLIKKHKPNFLIIQVGCDGLATDVHKQWNLTIKGFNKVIQNLINDIDRSIPIMILGGGGYNNAETAKCWTHLTNFLLDSNFPKDINDFQNEIPEHSLLDYYENDGYKFWTETNSNPSKMHNENTIESLQEIKEYLLSL